MNRSQLAAKVKALLSKTLENGATEAEAMSAAEKARELMDRYHLDHGALGMEEEGTQTFSSPFDPEKIVNQIKFALLNSVCNFTDTKGWRTSSERTFTFFGLKSDTDFATWLLDNLSSFVVNQAAAYRLDCILFNVGQLTRDGEASFQLAATERIKERLREMTRERTTTTTGRGLIPLKNQIVIREFEKLGIKLGRAPTSFGSRADAGAAAAGRAAGDRASFGRPVSTRNAGLLR